jgi:hypothetical protein
MFRAASERGHSVTAARRESGEAVGADEDGGLAWVRGWLAASLASWAAALTWHAAVGSDEGGGRGRARARATRRNAGGALVWPRLFPWLGVRWGLECAGHARWGTGGIREAQW